MTHSENDRNANTADKTTENKEKPLRSDALFKKILSENQLSRKDFLEQYLPKELKESLDLNSAKVESESYIEENLTRRYSDIVLSIKSRNNEQAFIYTLVEAQSEPDYWISFRLLRYTLLLCDRHKSKKNNKLPLVVPIVIYMGKRKYNAPMNFWELFTSPKQAKELLAGNYKLIDLQSATDEEIKQQNHIGMLNFVLKHVHEKNILNLWKRLFKDFKGLIAIDKENDYIYIKSFLWYTDAKLPIEQQESLAKLLKENLDEKGEKIMYTVADKYRDEGVEKGIVQGMEKGIAQGMEKGATNKTIEIAINMLRQNLDYKLIASVTGLSTEEILKLKAQKL